MNTIAISAAVVALMTGAIIYRTDIFCAVVLRPAVRWADDSSVADLLGRVHEYGDQRLPLPGIISILATALATATSDDVTARMGGAIALLALLAWLAIDIRISAPINKQLRVAEARHTVPADQSLATTLRQRHLAPRRPTSHRDGRAARDHLEQIYRSSIDRAFQPEARGARREVSLW